MEAVSYQTLAAQMIVYDGNAKGPRVASQRIFGELGQAVLKGGDMAAQSLHEASLPIPNFIGGDTKALRALDPRRFH
jgi:hypothetical protein